MSNSRRRHYTKRNTSNKSTSPALALGAALSGWALVASANSTTTIVGSTTSYYGMSGAENFEFSSTGTITTAHSPGLDVDSSVTNSTITLDVGGRLHSSGGTGLLNNGQVNLIDNNGTISSAATAIDNQSSISQINNTGLISGPNAIVNSGTLGAIHNAGTISGNISSSSSAVLTITGGSGNAVGTFTGTGGSIGTITNSSGNIQFTSGNLLLNDIILVGSNTVSNSGAALQVNNQLSITGNYSQSAASTLLIGVSDGASATGSAGADSGYGRLTVSGSANVAPGSSVALVRTGSTYSFAQGQRYVVIVANSSGTNYNASSLNYSATGYSGPITGAAVADGGNSDLVLTLGNSAPVNGATVNNASSALGGLFNYTGTQPKLLNLFNAAAAIGSDSATANTVGSQLSPIGVASANFLVSAVSSHAAASVVHSRLGQIRGGMSSGDAALDSTVWMQMFGSHINQGERDGLSGYHANFSGLMIGADRPVGDRWQAGAALSYSTSSLKELGAYQGSSVDSQAFGIHGYAGYDADNWYLDLDASIGKAHYDSQRLVDFPGFYGVANGTYSGTQYSVSAEAGWPIQLGGWHDTTLTPFVNLTYFRLEQSGYTESGGNGAALTVDSVGDDSVTSQLGARLEHKYDTRWGAAAAYVQLGWRHEYLTTHLQTTAYYAADASGATSFTNTGAAPLRDKGVLALGVTLAKSQQLSVSGQLQFEGCDSYRTYGANLTLRYRF